MCSRVRCLRLWRRSSPTSIARRFSSASCRLIKAAAFVLLRALRYEEADRELLLRVARFLLRRGDALSFNVASLMRLSFGLDELRGTFSLQLQPWQLDKMEQDWAYFSRQMNF